MPDQPTYPWTELYRPKSIDDVCLDSVSQRVLSNIIKTKRLPHLLLCGPPGTGKTTVVMNLIEALCDYNKAKKKSLTMHLNASDDRGVQVVRNQIECFAGSNALFNSGVKLVVLDEADAMTDGAQAALKLLISRHEINVRFCLICNYNHKIVPSLRDMLVQIRLRRLPLSDLTVVLNKIVKDQNSDLDKDGLTSIIERYDSDVRSMINEMQSRKIFGSRKASIKPEDLENLIRSILSHQSRPIGWHMNIHNLSNKATPFQCCKLLCKHILDTRPNTREEDYIDFATELYSLPPIGQKAGCDRFVESFASILSRYSLTADVLSEDNE